MNQTDSRGFPEVNTNVAWLYSMNRPSFLWPVWLFVASDILKCNKSLPLRYTILQLGYAHVSKGSSYHLSVVNQIVQFCYGKWTKHTKQKHDKPTFETAFNLLWGRSSPDQTARHIQSDEALEWISKGQNDTQSNHGGWHSDAVQTLGEKSIWSEHHWTTTLTQPCLPVLSALWP